MNIEKIFEKIDYSTFKWPNDIECTFKNSLYKRWMETGDPELAKQIRGIPFKEDI